MNTITDPSPTVAAERHVELDVIRGFALFGILLVNMAFFAYPFQAGFMLDATEFGTADSAALWSVRWLAMGKFYPLFSFLFGLGFWIFMERAEQRGAGTGLFLRRMLVLLGFGLVHGFFIWPGDILATYALIGLLLPLFRRRSDRAIYLWVAALLIWSLFISYVPANTIPADVAAEETAAMQQLVDSSREAYLHGDFQAQLDQRFTEFLQMLNYLPFFGPLVLAMFLLGMLAGRHELYRRPAVVIAAFGRPAIAWLLAGLFLGAGFATLVHGLGPADFFHPDYALGAALNIVAGLLMALGMAVAITWLVHARGSRALRALAPVGRMALTNYLLQSIVCTLLFYRYGLGLIGEVGPLGQVGVAMLIFALQVPFSHWWLARYRFGPAEWLWRTLIYGRLQPFHKAVAS